MKKVNIGIIGLGNIGKGVCNSLLANGALISRRSGVVVDIRGVCDVDPKALDAVPSGVAPVRTSDYRDLINDKDIDIIVELIGGIEPAKDVILSAISSGKHVVTANKALISAHWEEIFKAADDNQVSVLFEASVGGAIPVIRALKESFIANNINTVYGILNGTTNFILTMMDEKGCSFEEALGIAQQQGIAEPDPGLDVSGKDSAHKLAILSVLGYGADVSAEDIHTEGIENISAQDLDYARRWGYSIKLLAIAKCSPEGLQLRVHPTLISSSHLLSGVKGADNAIFIKGDLVDESLLFGKGAGSKPTASSVIGDVVDIARHVAFCGKKNPMPSGMRYYGENKYIRSMDDLKMSYYIRFSAIDKPGVLSGISSVLADNGISIASVSQEERNEGETVPLIILTHKAEEGKLRSAIAKIDKQEYITDKTVVIRREE